MTVYLNLENYMMFTYTSLALASEISQKLNYSIIINLVKITITLLLFQLHMSQLIQGALPIHTLP